MFPLAELPLSCDRKFSSVYFVLLMQFIWKYKKEDSREKTLAGELRESVVQGIKLAFMEAAVSTLCLPLHRQAFCFP